MNAILAQEFVDDLKLRAALRQCDNEFAIPSDFVFGIETSHSQKGLSLDKGRGLYRDGGSVGHGNKVYRVGPHTPNVFPALANYKSVSANHVRVWMLCKAGCNGMESPWLKFIIRVQVTVDVSRSQGKSAIKAIRGAFVTFEDDMGNSISVAFDHFSAAIRRTRINYYIL